MNVEAQANVLAYDQIREMEEGDEKVAFANALVGGR